MSSVTIHRTDPTRNIRRYYRLDVQQDLFGQWCCICEWGRIGAAGQTHSVPYPTLPPPRPRSIASAAPRSAGAIEAAQPPVLKSELPLCAN